jgi:hypothetical protein
MPKRTIYLAGPITGNKDFRDDFDGWHQRLMRMGWHVVNPIEGQTLGLTHEAYMKDDIPKLLQCTDLFAMPGWEGSKGAQFEVKMAGIIGVQAWMWDRDKEGLIPLVGKKYDGGKIRWDLVPWREMTDVAKVLTDGAMKYEDNNWKSVRPTSRYIRAAISHIMKWVTGSKADEDSGLHPLAHAICCLLFLMWFDKEDEHVGSINNKDVRTMQGTQRKDEEVKYPTQRSVDGQ